MSEDMSNLMNQINQMLSNNEIPEEIKNMMNNLKQNPNEPENESEARSEDTSSQNKESFSMPEFDIGTMMKMKTIMDSMKSNKDDPRANLLRSLKPYLKESRKDKVDQYIQIFNMGKVFEILNPLGGENKK